ncbi:uncharacterized protein [Dysidea avara]|uniref:uncharacterized protein isoform X2 n=1 Tax=Dysidea avara TaxID=196820 RepID=UPI0033282749
MKTAKDKNLSHDIPQYSDDRPREKHFNRHVKYKIGSKWREVAAELLGEDDELETKTAGMNDVSACCEEMFKIWLARKPTASWQKLIDALVQVKLNTLADEIKRLLLPADCDKQTTSHLALSVQQHIQPTEQQITLHLTGYGGPHQPMIVQQPVMYSDSQWSLRKNMYIEKFEGYDDAISAFTYVFRKLEGLCDEINFDDFKKTCKLRGAVNLPLGYKEKVQSAITVDDIFDILDNPLYCNWFNIRLLKTIVKNTEIPEAAIVIEAYDQWLCPKKVEDVKSCFEELQKKLAKECHISEVCAKINTHSDMTVGQVREYCKMLEKATNISAGSVTATSCEKGCLKMSCVIPMQYSLYALEMAKLNFLKLRQFHFQYIQIEIRKVFAMAYSAGYLSPSQTNTKVVAVSQVISHFYTYLESKMDADSISHMMLCEGLITSDDYGMITTAPSDIKINSNILQYVRTMDATKFLKFCTILKSIDTQRHIGEKLKKIVSDDLSLHNTSCDRGSAVCQDTLYNFEIKWAANLDVPNIHLMFFDLIDTFLLLLSTSDVIKFDIASKCQDIMASEIHQIPLFQECFLSKVVNCDSYFLLKVLLLPYLTWLDHSILRYLILASNNKFAAEKLKKFKSLIDYNQPIKSYPIPAPSQLMIPLDDSDYTLVVTKCDRSLEEMELRRLINIRDLLTEKLELTEYAIQLAAVYIEHGWLYWMIPRCVVSHVEKNITLSQHELLRNGIIMTVVFPKSMSDYDVTNITKSSPFWFLNVQEDKQDDSITHTGLAQVDYTAVLQHSTNLQQKLLQENSMLRIKLTEESSNCDTIKKELHNLRSDMKRLTSMYQNLKQQPRTLKSDHSYFNTSEPSSCKDSDDTDEQSKKNKGRPKNYHSNSPSNNSSSKVQAVLDKETLSVNCNNKQGNGTKKVMVTSSKWRQADWRRSRYPNCGKCVNCSKSDCGKCLSCKDKPKFGGNNVRKQRCVERICLNKPLSNYAKLTMRRRSTERSIPGSQITLDKLQLSYATRKRSLSQLNQSSSVGESTPENRPAKVAKTLSSKSKETTLEQRSTGVNKFSASKSVVSSSNSKLTITNSEKKEYSMRASSHQGPNKRIQKPPTVSTTPTATANKSTLSLTTKQKEPTSAHTIETSTIVQSSTNVPVIKMSELFPHNINDNVTAVITVPCLAGGSDVKQWSINDVEKFLIDVKYQQYITQFQEQEIDGQALLLMELGYMVNNLKMRVGDALKLHRLICILKLRWSMS